MNVATRWAYFLKSVSNIDLKEISKPDIMIDCQYKCNTIKRKIF